MWFFFTFFRKKFLQLLQFEALQCLFVVRFLQMVYRALIFRLLGVLRLVFFDGDVFVLEGKRVRIREGREVIFQKFFFFGGLDLGINMSVLGIFLGFQFQLDLGVIFIFLVILGRFFGMLEFLFCIYILGMVVILILQSYWWRFVFFCGGDCQFQFFLGSDENLIIFQNLFNFYRF